jgi:hypothetical protein
MILIGRITFRSFPGSHLYLDAEALDMPKINRQKLLK